MFRRISGGGGVCPVLKHLWVQYDFNKVQLSGRGRKELPIIRLWEKIWQNLVCRNCFNLRDALTLTNQWQMNEQLIESSITRLKRSMHFQTSNAKYYFLGFFFKVRKYAPKCVELFPNLTHFDNYFSKCIIFQSTSFPKGIYCFEMFLGWTHRR